MGLVIRVKGMSFTSYVDDIGRPESVNVEVGDFIATSGVSASYVSRLDTLVTSLKNAGIWNKITALYPFVGDSFDEMSYNLKDVNVAKLSLKDNPIIEVVGEGWKRKSGGYISTEYGFPADQLNDYHLLAWTDHIPDKTIYVPIGVGGNQDNGACHLFYLNEDRGGGTIFTPGIRVNSKKGIYLSNMADAPTNPFLFISSMQGLCMNGTIKQSKPGSEGGFANTKNLSPIVLGGYNANSTANPIVPQVETLITSVYKIAGFGKDLTTNEMITYSNILNQFKAMY